MLYGVIPVYSQPRQASLRQYYHTGSSCEPRVAGCVSMCWKKAEVQLNSSGMTAAVSKLTGPTGHVRAKR